MSLLIVILAGWFVLSLVVGVAFGRAARLGSGQTQLAGGPSDSARTVAVVATGQQARRHSGPAAA